MEAPVAPLLQEYVVPPEALNASEEPWQTLLLPLIAATGKLFTVTVC